ncbi:hypothetical protein WG899_21050 [Paucibacter sp. AS339]|uniref:hypothetical protein n=1 Tax=Paucibacter hankyongi TaxID=3133434 RepID=UPI00309489C9
MKLRPAQWLLIGLVLTGWAQQLAAKTEARTSTVYRCGPEGRDLRDSPCPSSLRASEMTVEYHQPSAAQAQAAKDRVAADLKRAQALEKARLKHEAEARKHLSTPTGIDGLKPIPAVIAASSPKPAQPPKPPKAPQAPKPVKKSTQPQPNSSEATKPVQAPKAASSGG